MSLICFFVSDLHGDHGRYRKLFEAITSDKPDAVFLGGDLLPHRSLNRLNDYNFVQDILFNGIVELKKKLDRRFPTIFIILGNDDPRDQEAAFLDVENHHLWNYCHNRKCAFNTYSVYGYSNVPPTPFRLKDWERYDVSRYVDPGCSAPEEGVFSVPVSRRDLKYLTIQKDLELLTDKEDLTGAIFLFHTPPYKTDLDRAALDGKKVDHVPLDVHVGSIAVKRFIENRQPLITLHGHIHESPRLTGSWKQQAGRTFMFSAAHDGPELALIRFDPAHPEAAVRELL